MCRGGGIACFVICVLNAAPARAQKLAGGQEYTLIVKTDGSLWAVGRNDEGQLGDGTTTDRVAAVQVTGLQNC